MKRLLLTDAIIDTWPELAKHRAQIEPCVVARGPGWIHLDADGKCWEKLKQKYILPPAAKPPEKIPPAPKHGPGTELHKIFSSLGISMKADCGCEWKMEQMDVWGVAGCRSNLAMIIGWMRDGEQKYSWADRARAARKAITTGLAFKINWRDPLPDIIALAIDRAEARSE